MRKLAITNFCISMAMLTMLIVAEIFRVKEIFGVITGIYWVILDLAVLIVSTVTGIFLWKNSSKK